MLNLNYQSAPMLSSVRFSNKKSLPLPTEQAELETLAGEIMLAKFKPIKLKYSKTTSPALLDDEFGKTIISVMKHLRTKRETISTVSRLNAFIGTALNNSAKNAYRRQRREGSMLPVEDERLNLRTSQSDYVTAEKMDTLATITKKAKKDVRFECLLLMGQGYKYEEIARKLKLPLGTVKSNVYKAREAMGIKLKKSGSSSR